MNKNSSQERLLQDIVAGRSLTEQIECVKRFGNHGTASVLRAGLFKSLGIPDAKKIAKNLIIFGCYIPFWYPFMIRDYVKLLDVLEIKYTYLERELCCGLPMIMTSIGIEQEKGILAGKEFMELNHIRAKEKGVTLMAYCCVGCAHMAKGVFPDKADQHLYILDLIVEKLEKKKLRVSPTVVGYFEGCQSRYHAIFPGVRLKWERYRQLLDRIEGLKIVDLPRDICCTKYSETIVENAEEMNVKTILCPCNGCYNRIGNGANERVQVKCFPEILLESLKVT